MREIHRSSFPTFALEAAALAAVLTIAGCGASGSSAPAALSAQVDAVASSQAKQPKLSSAQVKAIGQSVVTGVASSSEAMTVPGVTGAGGAYVRGSLPACVTESPNPPVDANGNGIPDDETYLFDCSAVGFFGGMASLEGTEVLVDTSNASVTSFTLTDENMVFASKLPKGPGFTETRNGTRSPSFSTSEITMAHDLTTVRTVTGDPSDTITDMSTLNFTTAGGAISPGQPLPSGTLAATGSLTWASGTTQYALTLKTPTALSYDATCSTPPRIVSGTVLATVADDGKTIGVISIVFSGCGKAPKITKI
jgi:hypothetical protein